MPGRQPAKKPNLDPSQPSSTHRGSSQSAAAAQPNDPNIVAGAESRPSDIPINQSPARPLFRIPQSPRSATGEAQAKAAKVAIPRIKRPIDVTGDGSTRSGGRHRVNHACEPCRHRKTKCSGERPVCRHCQDFKISCFYADGKRDRVKKQFGSMAERVADYERLLQDLTTRVSEDDAKLIKASLEKVSQSDFEEPLTDTGTAQSIEFDAETEVSGAESEVSGGVGSTGALDRTEEDFTREDAKITGFMGKNSDVTWIQRLRQENHFGESPPEDADEETHQMHNISSASIQSKREPGDYTTPLQEAADGYAIQDSSYHLDDLAITTLDVIDPYELPSSESAQLLYNVYMQRVHPSFPILGQVNLTAQFHRFIANPMQRPPDRWLAIVNLIFAISAKYSHLVQADWQGDDRDHIIYFNRARKLSIDHETLFAHPDLQLIQVMGLMSFYLMSTSQMNRAYTLAGAAIRGAMALGLNMRNESAKLKDSLKEIRYRLWWALYNLEHRLCSITGRVNCISDEQYTTPLPAPIEEDKFDSAEGRKFLSKETQQGDRAPSVTAQSPSNQSTATSHRQSRSSDKSEQSQSPSTQAQTPLSELHWAKDVQPSSSLYFLHMIQFTRLTQNAFRQLYNPASVERSWSYVQSQIHMLNEQLDAWCHVLPHILDFRRKQRDREFYEYRLCLGFAYYSTKQVVNRPCLCRLDRKIPGQSSKSHEFNRSSAQSCVDAAQEMLRLIPDEPNAVGLIQVGPWWTILPFLVQSATVLMLEISFRAHHMPEDADSILESSKKAIRWLHALGEDNLSAKRAWHLCNNMLHDAVGRIGRTVTDLPEKPPGQTTLSSLSDGTNMSDMSMADMQNMANHFHTNDIHVSMYGSTGSNLAYHNFANYDNLMQYDQYFPTSGPMGGDPRYNTTDPSDAEIDFMTSTYLENQADQHHSSSTSAGQAEMPGSNARYMP